MHRLHRVIALASRLPQSFHVCDCDLPAAVADRAGLLKLMCNDRNRVALYAYHLSEKFLGQRQGLVAAQFARATATAIAALQPNATRCRRRIAAPVQTAPARAGPTDFER